MHLVFPSREIDRRGYPAGSGRHDPTRRRQETRQAISPTGVASAAKNSYSLMCHWDLETREESAESHAQGCCRPLSYAGTCVT